jgi:hypothetical protein
VVIAPFITLSLKEASKVHPESVKITTMVVSHGPLGSFGKHCQNVESQVSNYWTFRFQSS